jgi:hypothetical protein
VALNAKYQFFIGHVLTAGYRTPIQPASHPQTFFCFHFFSFSKILVPTFSKKNLTSNFENFQQSSQFLCLKNKII